LAVAFRVRGKAMQRKEEELMRLVDDRTRELKQATSQLQVANRNLLELSAQDGLTGIANRRILDLTLEDEWIRAQRAGTPLSVVIADVDFFKRLNDRLGHQTGDQCLRLVASALASTGRRGMDCVARYGGEEFALLLPGVDEAGAALLAERARQAVAGLEFPHPDSLVGPVVTISLGVATACGNEFPGSQELVAAADSALYAAKRQGRNRVVSVSLGNRSLSVAVL
jgi:diguanylate cyclase (GGDEF)-like protein